MPDLGTGDPNLDHLSLHDWNRMHEFLVKLTDPEGYGFAVSGEVRREALELLAIFR